MKSKLESIFVIFIILLSITNIKFCADAINVLSDNTEKIYIAQSDIKNNQYLVTDEHIERISPKTMVESFIMQMGLEDREIEIYQDENKEVKIEEGFVGTGMIMTVREKEEVEVPVEENSEKSKALSPEKENLNTVEKEGSEKVEIETPEIENVENENTEVAVENAIKQIDYKLSIVGDTNQDGNANIAEVVQIINHLAAFEGKEITGIRLISSDINGDGQVNLIDIDKLIRYIVFEELEIGEVGAPKEPIIEVEGKEIEGWYKEAKVIIKTQEEEFKKTVYTIDGETYETINKEEEKKIIQSGIHKIQAYTYGKKENKSIETEKELKIDIEAPVIKSINKLEMQTKGSVRLEILAEDKLSGLAKLSYSFDGGETWQKENYKEYETNQEKIEIQVKDKVGNIVKEETSIENIVPKKQKYTITFKNEDGTVLQTEELEEGTMPIYKEQDPSKAEDETYTYEFAGWDKEITEVKGNVEYIATYKGTYKNYTVTFKDEDGTIIKTKTDYHYGDTVEVPEDPSKAEDETYTYEFAGWDKEITEVKGSVEYIATYKGTYKNYTVTFKDEDGTIIKTKTDYHYGDTVEIPENPSKQQEGYRIIFTGWDKEVAQVTKNEEYTATYTKEVINYTISYELNGGQIEAENPTTYNIETENFKLNNPIKEGFKFIGWILNEETESNEIITIEKGSIGDRKYTANWKLNERVKIKETDKIYETIEMALEEIENGQTIILIDNLSGSILIEEQREIVLDLNGKTITNEDKAETTIANKGTLTIIDTSEEQTGKIENVNNQAIVNETNALLNIGKDEEVSTSPYIKGEKTGIKNQGILNYYDGIIEGTKAIEGEIEKVAEDYSVLTENIGTKQKIRLVLIADSVARIDNNYYLSLADAVNSLVSEEAEPAEEQTTITILKDAIITEKVDIENYMNINLDLNGKTISSNANNEYMINNEGKLQIIDTSEVQTGKITTNANQITINNKESGELVVRTGRIETKKTYSKVINNEGKMLVEGGTITTNGYYSSYGIYNNGNGEIIMTGGKVIIGNQGYGIYNKGNGKITITGGKITVGWLSDAIYNEQAGTVEVTGGEIIAAGDYTNNDVSTIFNARNGKIIIRGGKIKAIGERIGIYSIENYGTGIVEVTGGEITSNQYGIYNYGKGTVKVTGGKIISSSYGIYNSNSGTVEVTGGEITSSLWGIYNYKTGTVNLGINDKEVYPSNYPNESKEEQYPTINAKYCGIYNSSGTFNYYDGIIIVENTSLNAIYGSINSVADIYNENNEIIGKYDVLFKDIDANEEEGIEEEHYILLGVQEEICVVLDSNNNELGRYNKISEAIKNCGAENAIQIIKAITTADKIEITEGKTVKLDLNGYTIKSTNNYVIENKGTLEITDTSEAQTGEIIGTNGIYNYGEGTVTVTKGNITTNNYISNETNYGIYNIGKKVILAGGKITINGGYNGYGISNNGTGTVEVLGGEITVTTNNDSYGIHNSSNGTVTVTEGKIVAASKSSSYKGYGIYNYKTGTVNLGINDKEVYPSNYSNESKKEQYPTINAKNYGIYNSSGTFNYYDGIIIVEKTSLNAIYGSINSVADIYNENNEIIGKYDVLFKDIGANEEEGTEEEHYVLLGVQEDICVVLDSNNNELGRYNKISEAIKNCGEETTIQIIKAITTADRIEIPEGKTVKLDLNGNTIKSTNNYVIENKGTLEITDTSSEQSGDIIGTNGIYNYEGGRVTLTKGNITISSDISSEKSYGIYNISGEIILVGGKIIINGKSHGYGISNNGTGTVEVIGGEITVTTDEYGYGIYNSSNGTLTVAGGKMTIDGKNGGCGISNEATGTVEVTGGEITSKRDGIHNGRAATGIVKVTGGKITVQEFGILNYIGKIIVTGGEITAREDGINNGGTVEVTGGKITSSNYSGIYNGGNGTLTVTGGKITSSNYTGINNSSNGTLIVTGGKITGSEYGIYNYGRIDLGINDKTTYPSNYPYETEEEYPVIKGNNYGIYNSGGTFNWYDGIIKVEETSERAIYGTVNSKSNIYDENGEIIGTYDVLLKDIEANEEEGIEEEHYAILGKQDENICVVLDANNNELGRYNKFSEAIKNCEAENTIQIIKAITIVDKIEITEGKTVKLDLNGYAIKSTAIYVIENKGNLEITDTSSNQTGEIIGTNGIYNYEDGLLTVTKGKITVTNDISSQKSYGIYNSNGKIILEGGKIISNSYGIYNSNSGIVEVTGGEITSNQYGIYNSNSGTVEVTGGNIIAEGKGGSVYGIYNSSIGKIVVEGGKIIATTENNYYNTYGVYNASNGTVAIGENEGEIPQNIPEIKSINGYGLYNYGNGIINFYDGVIIGKTNALYGGITDLPEGYTIKRERRTIESIENVEVCTLIKVATDTSEAQLGTKYYDTLQNAIKDCTDTNNLIILQREISVLGDEIQIEEGQEIIIDLNGYLLKRKIINNGTLTLTNSKGTVTEDSYGTIVGNGKLKIE